MKDTKFKTGDKIYYDDGFHNSGYGIVCGYVEVSGYPDLYIVLPIEAYDYTHQSFMLVREKFLRFAKGEEKEKFIIKSEVTPQNGSNTFYLG